MLSEVPCFLQRRSAEHDHARRAQTNTSDLFVPHATLVRDALSCQANTDPLPRANNGVRACYALLASGSGGDLRVDRHKHPPKAGSLQRGRELKRKDQLDAFSSCSIPVYGYNRNMDNNNSFAPVGNEAHFVCGRFDYAGRFVGEFRTVNPSDALKAYRDDGMTVESVSAKGLTFVVGLHDLRDAAGLVAAFGCGRGTTCSCR